MINIFQSQTNSVEHQVKLVFVITQHLRDEQLLFCIMEYLGCGNVYQIGEAFDFRVTKFKDIVKKIMPFFKKHSPIRGVKALDFKDFCLVAEMMKDKKHLTAEGLYQIRKIKAGMNTGRKIS